MNSDSIMESRVWAVCGDVMNENKFACRILSCLRNEKYIAYGLMEENKEEGIYNKLSDIPDKVDIVVLCANPETGLKVAKEAHKYGIKKVVAQPGARSKDIEDYCRLNDMSYFEDCILTRLIDL